MENRPNALVRFFGSSKAVMALLVLLLSFGALFAGKVTWDQVKEVVMVVVPAWLATHTASEVGHAFANRETKKTLSVAPPANP